MANPLYRVPVIGPWARRIGQVESIMSSPCGASAEIWIEGFFVNIPQLLWTFVQPDCLEAAIGRGGLGHKKRRKVRFDANGLIQAIEGDARTLPGYGKWLFPLYELSQRIGWWMMVIDATTDFAVHWTSTVYQYAGCHIPGGRWMRATNPGQWLNPLFNPQRLLWAAPIEGDGQLLAPGGTGVLAYQGMNPGIAVQIKTKEVPLAGPPTGKVTAYILDHNGVSLANTGAIEPDVHGNGAGTTFVKRPSPATISTEYQIWCECHDGYADMSDSTVTVVDAPLTAIKPWGLC